MKMIAIKEGTKTVYRRVPDDYVESEEKEGAEVHGDLTTGERKSIGFTDISSEKWDKIFPQKQNKMKLNLIMGARNGAKTERDENDFYATDPEAVRRFLKAYACDGGSLYGTILEPCAGNGHISEVLKEYGKKVWSYDLVQRDYPLDWVGDFLTYQPEGELDVDILTNPPFKLAEEFVKKGLSIVGNGHRVIMFLKIQFLEGVSRYNNLFKPGCLKYVYVHTTRQNAPMNGKFDKYNAKTQCYAWYVFEKGYNGPTTLRWIP